MTYLHTPSLPTLPPNPRCSHRSVEFLKFHQTRPLCSMHGLGNCTDWANCASQANCPGWANCEKRVREFTMNSNGSRNWRGRLFVDFPKGEASKQYIDKHGYIWQRCVAHRCTQRRDLTFMFIILNKNNLMRISDQGQYFFYK